MVNSKILVEQQNKQILKRIQIFLTAFLLNCSILNNTSDFPFDLCPKTEKSVSTIFFTSDINL